MPGQLALAGFNGLDIGEATPLRLTTIKSPRYQIGAMAADHILAKLANQSPEAISDVGFTFIAGQTA